MILSRWFRAAFLVLSAVVVLPVMVLAGIWLAARLTPVSPDQLYLGYQESWRVQDSDGQLLRELVNLRGERAEKASLARMRRLALAVMAVEDQQFLTHPGVDVVALGRALWTNLWSRQTVEGASTITMQLARLLWHHPRDLPGKLAQAYDALRLEAGLDKDRIIEAYLNLAPFAPGVQGGAAASRLLFAHGVDSLDWGEAALLAGLLQAPSEYDPRQSLGRAEERRQRVLRLLAETGVIDQAELQSASSQRPRIMAIDPVIRAGHFTDWVMSLHPAPGTVATTLDGDLQAGLEDLVQAHVDTYRDAGVGNAAVVVLDTSLSRVLAMVGSADWRGEGDGAVNGALAHRQPGSTLKPFAYSLAFENGYSPASILPDVETEYYGTDHTLYVPQNYSHSFRGPVTIQEALAASLNVPAIAMVKALGTPLFLDRLKALGFAGLNQDADYYGLGLVLGNGEVSLLELCGAYAVFPREGRYIEVSPFPAGPQVGQPVVQPLAASLVTSIIADDWLRLQAFGADSPLLFEFPLALKTGTSNNWRDTWVVGYSREFVVGVWAGNFNASPTNQLSGSVGAGPLFNKVIRLLAQRNGGRLNLPDSLPGQRTVLVCPESGLAPGPYCPRSIQVLLGPGSDLPFCTVHRSVSIDSRTGGLAGDGTPQRFRAEKTFSFLPPIYDGWLQATKRQLAPRTVIEPDGGGPALRVQKPRNGDVYLIEPGYERRTQSLPMRVLADDTATAIEWVLDDQVLAKRGWPFAYDWALEPGKHRLLARQSGNESDPVDFEVR